MRGRVVSNNTSGDAVQPVEGLYVCGWLKRGPTGIIATNLYCAEETVSIWIHIFFVRLLYFYLFCIAYYDKKRRNRLEINYGNEMQTRKREVFKIALCGQSIISTRLIFTSSFGILFLDNMNFLFLNIYIAIMSLIYPATNTSTWQMQRSHRVWAPKALCMHIFLNFVTFLGHWFFRLQAYVKTSIKGHQVPCLAHRSPGEKVSYVH